MNHSKLLFCIFCLLLLASVTNHLMAQDYSKKPNIIFVLVDDMGWGDLGFNGQKKIKTPAIDRMAREGMVMTNHYSGSTVCAPSRCALLTGMTTGHGRIRGLPGWTAVKGKGTDLTSEDITVGKELKRAGYATAVIGKWGMAESRPLKGNPGLPLNQGFDYFYGYETHGAAHHYYPEKLWLNNDEIETGNIAVEKKGVYTPDAVTDTALNYISRNKNNPFFLYLTYTIPHLELTVPEESKKQYEKLGWPLRKMNFAHYYNDSNGHVTYAGMISRLDTYVQRVLDHLKSLGIEDNTLVIFASDNGHEYDDVKKEFFNSNGPFRGHKRDLYEGGIRTPFIARWPGKITAGSKTDLQAAFWDFLPTACEIAGLKPSARIDGISYLPTLLNKPGQQKHEYLYWETNEKMGPIQAVRKGNWKAIKFLDKPIELYDLSRDISETRNVAATNPDIVKQMERIIATARTTNESYPLRKLKKNNDE